MEWLTNLLGFANNGTSPFGALGSSTAIPPSAGMATPPGAMGMPSIPLPQPQPPALSQSAPPLPPPTTIGAAPGAGAGTPLGTPSVAPAVQPPVAAPRPPAASGMQFPGLLGKLLGQQQQPGQAGQANAMGGGNNALLGQAMNLMKGPQFQPVQWMNLLGGQR